MPILDVSSWEAIPLSESVQRAADKIDNPIADGKRAFSRWRADVAPVDAYCYLHARFDKPNGLMMLAAPPDSENIFHWHWSLRSGDETIDIQGVGATVEYMISSVSPVTPENGKRLTKELKADFARFGAGMKAVRQELEKWTVFVNPYFRLERVVADLHARLASIKLHKGPLPDTPEDEAEVAAFQSLVRRWRSGSLRFFAVPRLLLRREIFSSEPCPLSRARPAFLPSGALSLRNSGFSRRWLLGLQLFGFSSAGIIPSYGRAVFPLLRRFS